MTPEETLDLPLTGNIQGQGLGSQTVRGYLINLLHTLWDEGECFSSKRPVGNSSWQYDLILTLVNGGAVSGSVDEYGFLVGVDESAADAEIRKAIRYLGNPNADCTCYTVIEFDCPIHGA